MLDLCFFLSSPNKKQRLKIGICFFNFRCLRSLHSENTTQTIKHVGALATFWVLMSIMYIFTGEKEVPVFFFQYTIALVGVKTEVKPSC